MKALIVVDLQNDFMPGGALGVKGGDHIVPIINNLMPKFPLVVATKDWHPPDHCSFVDLWPVHCVQGTWGAEFAPGFNTAPIASIFYKGTDPKIDAYSAFDGTDLADYLKKHRVTEIFLAGLTTEYCVLYSTLDAIDEGFQVSVIVDACCGVNKNVEPTLATIAAHGGKLIESSLIKAGLEFP